MKRVPFVRLGLFSGVLALLAGWGCGDDDQTTTDTNTNATTVTTGPGGAGSGGTGGAGGNGGGGTDPTCADNITTTLPTLPALDGVQAWVRGTRVKVAFEPQAGAKDYRIYRLPADAAVSNNNGEVHAQDTVYRCAGDRMAPFVELNGVGPDGWVSTWTEGEVSEYSRQEADTTMGYVFREPGAGRVAMYAVGSPDPDADGQCFDERWGATRLVEYVDETERQLRLAAGWRDDGVAFYVPADGDRQIYSAVDGFNPGLLYFADAAELAARPNPAPAFKVLSAEEPGAVPLLRVFYDVGCGTPHDVLAAGAGRFERLLTQGNQPIWEVTWPELKAGDVLVLEALDEGCPWQGHLSPRAVPAGGEAQEFVTLDAVQAGAPFGELFINGQHTPGNNPQATARSFVCVDPVADEAWDYLATFDAPLSPLVETGRDTFGGWNLHFESSDLHVDFYSIEPDIWAVDTVHGELWTAFADWGAGTNGKVRITPKQKATLAAATFIHASVEVDIWATGRRYPQLWISDHPVPVQDSMDQGTTLNLQTFSGWPTSLQLQFCQNQTWDVNAQCPMFHIERETFTDEPQIPHQTVGEHAGIARMARLDLYTSTTRAYVFLDGQPYGCADLPAGAFSPGEVAVTTGDVLYHSGVDEIVVGGDYHPFHLNYMLTETRRHYDNLAFSSGVAAPAWDETRFPCTSVLE